MVMPMYTLAGAADWYSCHLNICDEVAHIFQVVTWRRTERDGGYEKDIETITRKIS